MNTTLDLRHQLYDLIEKQFNQLNHFSFDKKTPKIRLHEATFGPEEIMAFLDCMLTTQVTMGPKVKAFEEEFSKDFGFSHGIMNNSGSSANLLAIAALTNPEFENYLKPGDEVIVPALSWSTTVWPLIQCNLTPVIVDIDPLTLNIDPEKIEKAIGPKTRAVMIVPVYGNPCKMDEIVEICQRKNLILIEDCCEALGAYYNGKAVGSFGSVGTFSFYFSHHITTLEGGITVTNDQEIAELLLILRSHGWLRQIENKEKYLNKFPDFNKKYPDFDPRFLFVNLGYNLRPTDPQAAMGSIQLLKLKSFVETRRKNAQAWQKDFERFEGIFFCQKETHQGYHSWFGFPLTLTLEAPFSVAEIRSYLEAEGIETRPLICGNIAEQPAMKLYPHRIGGDLKNADNVMVRSFSFGNHQFVDEEARSYITDKITNFVDKYALKKLSKLSA